MQGYLDLLDTFNTFMKLNRLCKTKMFEFCDVGLQEVVDQVDELSLKGVITFSINEGVSNTFTDELKKIADPTLEDFEVLCKYLSEIMGLFINKSGIPFNVVLKWKIYLFIFSHKEDRYFIYEKHGETITPITPYYTKKIREFLLLEGDVYEK